MSNTLIAIVLVIMYIIFCIIILLTFHKLQKNYEKINPSLINYDRNMVEIKPYSMRKEG